MSGPHRGVIHWEQLGYRPSSYGLGSLPLSAAPSKGVGYLEHHWDRPSIYGLGNFKIDGNLDGGQFGAQAGDVPCGGPARGGTILSNRPEDLNMEWDANEVNPGPSRRSLDDLEQVGTCIRTQRWRWRQGGRGVCPDRSERTVGYCWPRTLPT